VPDRKQSVCIFSAFYDCMVAPYLGCGQNFKL